MDNLNAAIMIIGTLIFLIFLVFVPQGSPADRDPLSGEALYRDVKYYSGLGSHRTATKEDLATSQWLLDRLNQAGYSTRIQEWKTKQFFPKQTFIDIDHKKRIEAFPVWWPRSTDDQGISAPLSSDLRSVKGQIYLYRNITGPGFSVDEKLIRQVKTAAEEGAKAVVLASSPDRGDIPASNEFIGLNALQSAQEEWPLPVIMVGIKDWDELEAARVNHSEARLVSTGAYDQAAVARNVIGSLVRHPGNKTILISTPSSGWFNCAGERGSGIALWLDLAEWAAKNTTRTNLIFIATSGHEIKGLGTEYFLNSPLAPPPGEVFLWIHIGAWQAMYDYILKDGHLEKTNQMSDKIIQYVGENLTEAVKKSFGDQQLKVRIVPRIVFGDLTQVIRHGYKNLAGISFGHVYHHSTQDLPKVTGPEMLEPIARAYQKFLLALKVD